MSNITNLPFVAYIGKGKNKVRSFWSIRPNGSYQDECLLGQAYANEALRYINEKGFSPLLGWIVRDMQKQENHSGIEIGFMHVIAQYAICGVRQTEGVAK